MTDPDAHDTFWKLVQDIRFAMFTSRMADGGLHTRPLTLHHRDAPRGDALWFFVSRGSDTFDEVRRDAEVSVAFADPDKDRYVGVTGRAESVEDAETRRRLWHKFDEAWFPKGPEDPDVALLRVDIRSAEYWDVKQSKPVQLFKMAAAALTGNPPQDLGEHRSLRMD